jgi:hypothetical protein
MVLLECSLEPSVSGWYADDVFNFTLLIFVRVFQNCDVNNLLRSEMMLSGIPFSQYHLSKKILASCSAVISYDKISHVSARFNMTHDDSLTTLCSLVYGSWHS